jgi:hypothetical protein
VCECECVCVEGGQCRSESPQALIDLSLPIPKFHPQLTFAYASPGYQRELGYDPTVLQEQSIDFVKVCMKGRHLFLFVLVSNQVASERAS